MKVPFKEFYSKFTRCTVIWYMIIFIFFFCLLRGIDVENAIKIAAADDGFVTYEELRENLRKYFQPMLWLANTANTSL